MAGAVRTLQFSEGTTVSAPSSPSTIDYGSATVTTTGDVGIGTSNPTFASGGSGLEIEKAGVASLRLENTSASTAGEIYQSTNFIIRSFSANNIQNMVAENQRVLVSSVTTLSSGDVALNIDDNGTPKAQLGAVNNANGTSGFLNLIDSNGNDYYLWVDDNGVLRLANGGQAEVGSTSAGTSVATAS